MVEKANSLEEALKDCPKNQIIADNLIRTWTKINSSLYSNILCGISGGSIVILCWTLFGDAIKITKSRTYGLTLD